MIKTSKKILSVLVLMSLSFMLAACKDKGSDKPGKESGEKTVTVNVYRKASEFHYDNNMTATDVSDAVNTYLSTKNDVRVNISDLPDGEYEETVKKELNSKKLNIFMTSESDSDLSSKALSESAKVMNLSDLFSESLIMDYLPEEVVHDAKALSTDSKDMYVLPKFSVSFRETDLIIRKDLCDKYNIDASAVKSIYNLEKLGILDACLSEGYKYPFLTDKTALFTVLFSDEYDFNEGLPLLAVKKDTNTPVQAVYTDEYKEFITVMADWAQKGYINYGEEATKTTPSDVLSSDDWGVTWKVEDGTSDARTIDKEIVSIPVSSKYAIITKGSSNYAVGAASKDETAKACAKLLTLLYSDDTLSSLFNYGTKGHEDEVSVDLKGAKIFAENGFSFDDGNSEQFAACKASYEQYGFVLENGGFASDDLDFAVERFESSLTAACYDEVFSRYKKACEER